jgi:hypothetical protein
MKWVEIFIPVYFAVFIISGLVIFISYIFFHIKFTDEVIKRLSEEGFCELSEKLRQIILITGKFPLKGISEQKILFDAWREFSHARICKNMGKIYKIQWAYRIICILLKMVAIFSFLPVTMVIIGSLYYCEIR